MLRIHHDIPIPVTEQEGIAVQTAMAPLVAKDIGWGLVTGVKVSFDKADIAYAVAVSVSTSHWKPVEIQRWTGPAPMGYASGLLGFREGPPMLEALLKLTHTPDVIFVEGHGQAHPRKFGPACHVGLALDHPTIGISLLYPENCGQPKQASFAKNTRGNKIAIMNGPHKVGYEVVTRPDQNPIYISVGNRLGLDAAVALTIRATPVYHIPEPIRAAQIEIVKYMEQHR